MRTQENTRARSGNSIIKGLLYGVAAFTMGLMLNACSSNDDRAHLMVRMTDAPANYDAVLIDLQAVEVTGSGSSTVMLNVNAGLYNLLDFSNGLDTLIASGDLEAGTVSQIRLILGSNNSVVVDGVSHPLSTPSAQQSGLKIQVHRTFEPGVSYALLLDFDAHQSIVQQGNGSYQLKPVIRVVDLALNGSVRGSISPAGVSATITVTDGVEGYSSVANSSGAFLVSGIPAGTYEVVVSPSAPLLPITIPGVSVSVGAVTDLGVVVLN